MTSDWRFPSNVFGWLSESEGRKLAELATGKNVLEIGSYHGCSTICMAQTAESVVSIDPGDGRATPEPGDTTEALQANLFQYGVRDKVKIHVGTTAEIAPEMSGGFDLIFIDGDHSRAALEIDINEASRLLSPSGLMVFHDYNSPKNPAVTIAVNELIAGGDELASVVGTLAIVRPGGKRRSGRPLVMLCMPRRGENFSFGAGEGFYLAPTNGAVEIVRMWTKSSLLDHAFNRLWASALNYRHRGISHIAFIHDDIGPAQGWVDTLMAEMLLTGADFISAVVPIKCEDGTTSTAIESDEVWMPRRLTLKEVHELPETFTDDDVGGQLLLNTGICLIDIRKPWVDEPTPLCFQCLNRIVKDETGRLVAQVRSEDWEFSRAARARGAKLVATRKVSLYHAGELQFRNDQTWGWDIDKYHVERVEKQNRELTEATV